LRLLVAIAGLLLFSACSGSKHGGSANVNATVADNSNSNATSGSCPFSGSTQSQTQTGSGNATTLTKAIPSTAGCIDNVQLNFSPSLATTNTAYKTASGTGSAVLVMTLSNTTLGSGMKTGTTTNAHGLNYVKSVDVENGSTGVTVSITLDEKRPFLVNSSNVPAEVQLAIG
jgi:hypothetical protein